MHTTEVLFKFLKFLPLWLLMANKACEISKKPALKKPNSHPISNTFSATILNVFFLLVFFILIL